MAKICIDGIDALGCLFPSQDALIEHIIEHTLFFNRDMVLKQARDIRGRMRTGKAVPARFTSNKNYFLQHAVKTTTPRFKNKSEAVAFTKYDGDDETKCLFHRETKIRVSIDADGNYAPKRTIYEYTNQLVSCGQRSTVVNYTIAHIWAKTDNPLFFNSLWNYALLPTHCAFLTDKRDDSHPMIARIKELIRAISWELYNPNRIMDWNQDVVTESDKPSAGARTEARRLIAAGKINFLPVNEPSDDAVIALEEPTEAEDPTEINTNE